MIGRVIDSLRDLLVLRALTLVVILLLPAQNALAQRNQMEDATALGACAACSGVMILIPIGVLALNIYLAYWVYKDANKRGMDNAVVWLIVTLLFSLLGFAIYLFSRPKDA